MGLPASSAEHHMRTLVRRAFAVSRMSLPAAILIAACGPDPCDLSQDARRIGTASAKDCGRFAIGQDASAGVTCALDAQAGGQSFLLRIDQAGIDSQTGSAFVRTPDGKSFQLLYDSAGASVGSGAAARMNR